MTSLYAQLSLVNMASLGGIELTPVQLIMKLLGTSFIVYAARQLTFLIAKEHKAIARSIAQLHTKLSDSCT